MYKPLDEMDSSPVKTNGSPLTENTDTELDPSGQYANNSNNVTADAEVPLPNTASNDESKEMKTVNGYGKLSDHDEDEEAEKVELEELEAEVECGWRGLRPRFLQCFNKPPGILLFLCLFAVTQGMTVNGFVYVVTTTLERRFNLPSVRSGSISSSYDFSVMIVITFVTYLGDRGHKPLWLGAGALLFALGSYTFTLPHFLTPFYDFRASDFELCQLDRNITDACSVEGSGSALANFFWLFVFAQFLHGLGAAPLYTLGVTYIDENVQPKMTSLYIGIFNAASLLGPAIGYLLGGALLSIYTDIRVDSSSLGIDPDSPLWIGAWWVGFLISGTLALSIVLPFLGFPKALPGQKKLAKLRVSECHGGHDFSARTGFGNSLRDFPRAVLVLIKNLPFMFITASACTEWFILSSFAVFAPKFLESQFNLTSGWASIVVGLTVIPAAVFGSVIGGWVVKHFNLMFKGMIKFCLAMLIVSLFMIGSFLISCPNPDFAGVTVDYDNNRFYDERGTNLSSTCNSGCHCADTFEPICGVDNVMYYSPCHAGCEMSDVNPSSGIKSYHNCSCITVPDSVNDGDPIAVSGKCTSSCQWQPLFLALLFLLEFFTILAVVPATTATLRCVPHSQRSFALGLQSLFYRALGTVPGPVIFGAIIDHACLLWEYDCDGSGTCWLYSNANFSRFTLILSGCLKIGSISFFLAALFSYKPPTKTVETGSPATRPSQEAGTELQDVNEPVSLERKWLLSR
ncbi:solute carrier organic anion transporter family member 4A1-like [Patiria miniata]|uniref:Solute carrier organic anion transporter family member n=1 Tax=Patiria miniata TaxID=46514 RepID=A0A913ZK88_PATMI|nr:solute carrier organic anion transporter family member 4A1-like [Patiria miniata]XP_038052231.1 solute carrier organic anion transporter family member 4A1-like [Patiria miniata]XP_038052232.1 solute carrier organic anion transporter family member 4A1-like [Patiria miniata]